MPGNDNKAFHTAENDDFDDDRENVVRRMNKAVIENELDEKTKVAKRNPAYGDLDTNSMKNGKTIESIEPEEVKQSCSEVWRDYPKSVFCIVGNEFCERFSYYGMRAVLTLYLVNILKYSHPQATQLYSGFVMLCYFSPILGSILADGYIGKFHTIMWVSLFYAAGNVTIAVASAFDSGSSIHPWLDFIGLAIIGLGTGGIKPCVQTFGGDQFRKGQEKQLLQFFSIFYFAINAGSTISILLTPILRTMPCQGQESCYPMAFGIPAGLMIIAVVFFAVGSYWYKKVPPEGNVFARVAKVIYTAVKNRRFFDIKREHWLDHYMDSHSCQFDEECRRLKKCHKAQFVQDIKALFRVLVVYIPLPIFWALYEQQGSTWVLQGSQMDGYMGNGVWFLPDQMGVLNAVLILVLIPTFQIIIYPLVGKVVKLTPLRKMCVGGFLAGVAYVVCMAIQFKVDPTLPALPKSGQAFLTFDNATLCSRTTYYGYRKGALFDTKTVDSSGSYTFTISIDSKAENVSWVAQSTNCPGSDFNRTFETPLASGDVKYTILTRDSENPIELHDTSTKKSDSGEGFFTLNINHYVASSKFNDTVKVDICIDAGADYKKCSTGDKAKYSSYRVDRFTSSDYAELKPANWSVFVRSADMIVPAGYVNMERNGGIYTLTLVSQDDGKTIKSYLNQQAPDNTVSILWQIPQYFVISVAEILFSISGNEFAYSQAPLSMKAVVMALWLLTDSVGQIIVLIISSIQWGFSMAWVFLIYAGIMVAIMFLFVFIAYGYKSTLYVRDDKKPGESG